MIFSVRQLQEKCREQRRPLFIALIDLTKAVYLVGRRWLFNLLERIGCPPKLLSVISSFHSNMKGTVNYDGATSEPFEIRSGENRDAFWHQHYLAYSSPWCYHMPLRHQRRVSTYIQDPTVSCLTRLRAKKSETCRHPRNDFSGWCCTSNSYNGRPAATNGHTLPRLQGIWTDYQHQESKSYGPMHCFTSINQHWPCDTWCCW